MFAITNLCILLCITCHFQAYGADKYTDENRPYEFGFTIDGEQHRHEKKDENGIIMGEFGFITADGVYHVTVYATDENGNFKILSMKNIRVKPYPTAPGVAERKKFPVKQSQIAITSATSAGVRQGHSISLASPQQVPAYNKQQINVKNEDETVRSCSHCKVPTTTPRVVATTENKQVSQNTLAEPALSLRTPFENHYSSESPKLNIPSSILVDSNQQTRANYDNNNLQQYFYNNQNQQPNAVTNPLAHNAEQSIYDNNGSNKPTYSQTSNQLSINNNQNPVNQQPNAVTKPLVPNTEHSIYDDNGSNKPIYSQTSDGRSEYQPNLFSRQNIPQSFNPEFSYPEPSIDEINGKQFLDAPATNQFALPHKNFQAPTIDQNYSPFFNAGQPNSLNLKEKQNDSQNNEHQNISQIGSPPSIGNGYRHPKSFKEILQTANPNHALLESSQPGANHTPRKPVLIAAQMQVVDKNTDIYHKNPGEVDGLPKGLNTGDVADLLYTFNYTVGFHGHHEKGYTNGVKIGYYYVIGRNGVRTRVDYVADENGFRPKISQEVLDILSDEVPKPETEKDEKYGLKGYEFKWVYYPVDSKRR